MVPEYTYEILDVGAYTATVCHDGDKIDAWVSQGGWKVASRTFQPSTVWSEIRQFFIDTIVQKANETITAAHALPEVL